MSSWFEDCLDGNLDGMELESFHDGFRMHEETARMEDPHDYSGHGGTQISYLMQATNQNRLSWTRDRVSIEVE